MNESNNLTVSHEKNEPSLMEHTAATGTNASCPATMNESNKLTGSHKNNEPSLMESTAVTGNKTSSDKMCTTTLMTNADHDDSMDECNHLDIVSITHFFSNMEKEVSETMNIESVYDQRNKLKSISTKYMSRCWVTDSLRIETENLFPKKEDIDGNNNIERNL